MTFQPGRMNDAESDAWLGLVGLMELLPASLDAQMRRDSGMTHFEFVLLTQLKLAERNVLQTKQLAEATNSTLPRLSHVITRLVERGLVERVPCPGDGRATNVVLTAEGRRAVVRATGPHLAHVRAMIFDRLTADEVASLASATGKITAALDPSGRYAGPIRG